MKEGELISKNKEESTSISTDLTLPQISITHRSTRIYILRQHAASFLANIPSMSTGIALAWSATAVPVLLGEVESQPLRLSLEQASWVGGMLPLTSLVGALVAGPLADSAGRKGALLLGAVPTVVGWLLIMFARSSLWMLLVGRALTGLSMGAVSGPAALYCEEIADVRVRGALGTYQFLMNCIGTSWGYGFGGSLPYFWFTATPLLPSLAFVLTFAWLPESPAFLAVQGRHHAAHKALRWFRGPDIDCDRELEMLLASKSKTSESPPRRSFLSLCSRRPWRSNALRGAGILSMLMFLQQMTGIGLFTFYTVQVFQEAGGNISSHLSAFITAGCLTSTGVLLSTITVDRVGRRKLLVVSFVTLGVILVLLSIYSHLKNNEWNIDDWKWVPLALLMGYFLLFGLGAGSIPWFLMAELLPMYAKGWASPTVVCINRIFMFIIVKQAPLMLFHTGEVPTYAMFCVFCFVSAAFVIFYVPETKGKTKEDILFSIGGDDP